MFQLIRIQFFWFATGIFAIAHFQSCLSATETFQVGTIEAVSTLPDDQLDVPRKFGQATSDASRKRNAHLSENREVPPLLAMVDAGECAASSYLVGRGCDVNVITEGGISALMLLSMRSKLNGEEKRLFQLLLAAGANPNHAISCSDPPSVITPTILAFQNLNVQAIKLLLDAGCAPPARWPVNLETERMLMEGKDRNRTRNSLPSDWETRTEKINEVVRARKKRDSED